MKLLKLAFCIASAVQSQTSSEVDFKFEVASIKPSSPTERGSSINRNPGSLITRNFKVQQLIQVAYRVQEYQVTGGPGWVKSDGYDIVGKFDQPEDAPKLSNAVSMAQTNSRLRNLLVERFLLKMREETKELPIYSITLGKNGHKLKSVDPGSGESMSVNQNNSSGTMRCTRVTLKSFADSLGNILGRPVVNETGLDGTFDFELTWSADLTATADQSGPSIFTALQEQLGLKLESKKGLVKVYVIEQVQRPTEN